MLLHNWQTTLASIIGLVAYVVGTFGIQVSSDVQNAIIILTVFVVGLLSRDAGHSGDTLHDV
jgi:hypothetical protein